MDTSGPSRLLGPVLLLVAAAGLVVAVAGAWRPGILVVGGALAVTAAIRLLRPGIPLGTLAVRAGWLDAAFLFATGVALLVTAIAL